MERQGLEAVVALLRARAGRYGPPRQAQAVAEAGRFRVQHPARKQAQARLGLQARERVPVEPAAAAPAAGARVGDGRGSATRGGCGATRNTTAPGETRWRA